MIPVKNFRKILLSLLLVSAGLVAGFSLAVLYRPHARANYPVRGNSGDLTNPLLDFEIVDFDELGKLGVLRTEIDSLIEHIQGEGKVKDVALYFRDLNNGPWLGVHEEAGFIPGSLFKVPLVIACLLQAEKDPAFLRATIKCPPPPHPDLVTYRYPPPVQLVTGKEYTVKDLVERTCRYSDNMAAFLLVGMADPDLLREVFIDLDLDTGMLQEEKDLTFSPVQFGRFFRILYNASYLSREMSEYALGNFAQSTFHAGLAAGVPPGTLIAHKFGENIEGEGEKKLYTLHDAGIIYHKQRPYLLCVMTRGTNYDAQAQAIAACSTLVWRQVNLQGWDKGSD